ncbi:MAG: hypothetical protein ACYSR5_06260 [Planctomycetota bacterium]|jgi:hypothetical protein
MKANLKNTGSAVKHFLSRAGAEKKKTLIAFCLISVMVFMWARVLGKKTSEGPRSARAAHGATTGQPNAASKVSFVELPKARGRNDRLTRDCFASNGWKDFLRSSGQSNSGRVQEVNIVSKGGSEEVARRIAEKLRLEAIVLGESPQAFINDKLLKVGDRLPVKDGLNTYQCEVVGMTKNTVFVRCGKAEIKLKLAAIEVAE